MTQQWDNEELKEATTMRSKGCDHDLVQEEIEGNWGNKGDKDTPTLSKYFAQSFTAQDKLYDSLSDFLTPNNT